MEKWKSIKGYEGLYEVSNRGKIKSLPKDHGHYITKEKVMKLQWFPYKGGGYIVSLKKDSKAKSYWVARLVGLHFKKNPLNLPQINHKDLNKRNNRVKNLEWVTESQNVQHSWDTNKNRGTNAKTIILKRGKEKLIFTQVTKAADYLGVSRIRVLRHYRKGKELKGYKIKYKK